MGFFSKKEKGDEKKDVVPSLPELPRLPSFPDGDNSEGELPQLPSFPKNDLGEKFSQDTIKKAVNGKREEEKEISEDEFEDQMNQESPEEESVYGIPGKISRKEVSEEFEEVGKRISGYASPGRKMDREIPAGFEEAGKKIMDSEPVFVRIDKFEESRKIFEKTKEQIMDIEKALGKIKSIKQEEDQELESWQQEILSIKDKIGKIEKDIFSKVQ